MARGKERKTSPSVCLLYLILVHWSFQHPVKGFVHLSNLKPCLLVTGGGGGAVTHTLIPTQCTQAAYAAEQHPATTFEPPFVVGCK